MRSLASNKPFSFGADADYDAEPGISSAEFLALCRIETVIRILHDQVP